MKIARHIANEENAVEMKHTNEQLKADSIEIGLVDQFLGSFTIEELTKNSTLSHVSVRKYVRYLETSNILEAHST